LTFQSGININKDGAGYVFSARSFIVADVYFLKLRAVWLTSVGASQVNTMLTGYDLPILQR
jgi:hypothetical protein